MCVCVCLYVYTISSSGLVISKNPKAKENIHMDAILLV